jgi:hypothetical protein
MRGDTKVIEYLNKAYPRCDTRPRAFGFEVGNLMRSMSRAIDTNANC